MSNSESDTALTVSAIDPIDISCSTGFPSDLFDGIEINTGYYSELKNPDKVVIELLRIRKAANFASEIGLRVFAGHGLTLDNVAAIASIPEIEELNIGHFLVAQSVYMGIENAVKEMIQAIRMAQC